MAPSPTAKYAETLNRLNRQNRGRRLIAATGHDFASNDYLGLSHDPRLRQALSQALADGVAIGAGGSRLLRGNHPEHEKLEARAARFFNAASTLYMATGYLANIAIFATLPQRGDIIIIDELAHASIKEGLHLSPAKNIKVPHNDLPAFEHAIQRARTMAGGRLWLAVESLYSMAGDKAPLAGLYQLAEKYNAMLVVDEAHATGVFGDHGQGLADHAKLPGQLITLHTCGKAMGAAGALICLPEILKNYMINKARSFIFTTAPSPLMATAVHKSLDLIEHEPERREQLKTLYARARNELQEILPGQSLPDSPILPVMIGDNKRAVEIAKTLQTKGFDIRAIRPPTVPEGTARLRLSITLNVNQEIIRNLISEIRKII